ncbi:MAG: hypothetical protein DME65_15160 [Verrucomicrobia bacterium]|nr:MAG: hypothetical protein DME65_15160 [Verrucomicrobiota bacterium]
MQTMTNMKRRRHAQTHIEGRTIRNIHGEQGFTLLETTIALLVMLVGALAIGSLFVLATNYNSDAGGRSIALAVAQQQMEELRKTPSTDASLNAGSRTTTFTSGNRQYSIVTTICSTSDCGGSAALKIITIQVSPQTGSRPWARGPVTVISQRATPVLGAYLQ